MKLIARKSVLKNMAEELSAKKETENINLIINMAFQDHLRKSLPHVDGSLIFDSHTGGPSPLDHHIMLEGIGISNLIKYLNYLSAVQGLPEKSLALSLKFLKRYQGHPYFTLMHAEIRYNQERALHGDLNQNVIDASVRNAVLGMWWYGRQGWAYGHAHSLLKSKTVSQSESLNQIVPHDYLLYGIASDYPFIHYCAKAGFMRPYDDLIDWSSWNIKDFNTLAQFYRHDQNLKAWLMKKAEGRFLGHPSRYKFELAMNATASTIEDKKLPYIQMIDQGNQNWKIYYKLGELYINEGEYRKAKEVFLSYPGFAKDSTENRVYLSNQSHLAGSLLFWKGAYDEARPLYEYSAALNTGSDASLTSRARVAILDRDFMTAADYMLRRAKRYDTRYGYRDYMSITHTLDDSKKAWNQFTEVLGKYSTPQIWTSALVGHRIQKSSKDDLKSWIKGMADLSQTSRKRSFPARFAFMCLVDRPPDKEMAAFVETVDDLSDYDFTNRRWFKSPDGEEIGPHAVGRLHYTHLFSGKKGFGVALAVPMDEFKKAEQKYYEVDIPKEPFSFYGSIAFAYENLKEQSFAEAYNILKKQSYLYSYYHEFGKPIKPYLIWAGMNSDNSQEIEHFLMPTFIKAGIKQLPGARKPSKDRLDFDDELAIAAYQCSVDKNDQAIERIKKAFYKRPHTGSRPLCSYYQIVELCEWFYEYSKDRRYLELALKWSKDYQVIAPMHGWSYAFEAKYVGSEPERLRALGIALYLDAQSWRIAHFTDAEKKQAKKWFKANNPFRKSFKDIFVTYLKNILQTIDNLQRNLNAK